MKTATPQKEKEDYETAMRRITRLHASATGAEKEELTKAILNLMWNHYILNSKGSAKRAIQDLEKEYSPEGADN